ncbi:cytochrome b [Acetobacter conturbans]|uniref:Cytochrome b n=1 Tax=Acetobacter conturbans TaxID=1737472 RepID=A0ABX0K5E4_9PROT|nr:cytochrome b/b6 domain-containing protein [Acetobacter conturbans]NHN90066.1 cytochrome b [Acetobacter conturbans]
MSAIVRFSVFARMLHWLMAAMILTMLFIGVFMAATEGTAYNTLLAFHRPTGLIILALAIIRLGNRFFVPPPPLPASLPRIQRMAALGSHILLYGLMIAMPLVGWGMLSAGAYPIVFWGSIHLPPILPHNPALFALLRHAHTWFGLTFFAVIVIHLGAALLHALILRDGVFPAMASWRTGQRDED